MPVFIDRIELSKIRFSYRNLKEIQNAYRTWSSKRRKNRT